VLYVMLRWGAWSVNIAIHRRSTVPQGRYLLHNIAITSAIIHVTRGSVGNLALTVLEGSVHGLRHQGRPKRQWMDDIKE